MKGMLLGTVLAAFLLAISGCATTTEKALQERGLSPLTQAELEALHSRTRTIRGITHSGITVTGTLTSDGVAKLDCPRVSHEGTWRIKEGKFCTQYPTVRNGVERCANHYKIEDNKYQKFNSNGSFNSTFSYTN